MVFNHLATSQKHSDGFAPQGVAACTGHGRGSWLQGLSILGVCGNNTGQRRQCHLGNRGHRRLLGRLEISSTQLLDSE